VVPPLSDELAAGPVVLDGGLSAQLAAAGHDLSDPLWTARLLLDDPAAITAAHLANLTAGASVVITASYQVSFGGFAARGIDAGTTRALLRRGTALARDAVDRARESGVDRPLRVAASIGPYGAVLADGSEYRGRYGLTRRQLEEFHRPRAEAVAESGPDLLAVETVPDADEAEAVLRIVADLGVPAWLSYTVDGTRTRAGQPLDEAFAVAAGVPEVIAVGVNCSHPRDVAGAVAVAAETTGKPVVVYPNSGEEWDAEARDWTGRPASLADRAGEWVDAGARLVGGCCRVGSGEIAALARVLAAR
jgi:S-methylmethionine-dependent homocysteine/selenocysteine methylase